MTQVNPYNVYGYCYGSATVKNRIHFLYTNQILQNKILTKTVIPCTDTSNIENYLNTPKVQAALHITQTKSWEACSEDVGSNYNVNPDGSY